MSNLVIVAIRIGGEDASLENVRKKLLIPGKNWDYTLSVATAIIPPPKSPSTISKASDRQTWNARWVWVKPMEAILSFKCAIEPCSQTMTALDKLFTKSMVIAKRSVAAEEFLSSFRRIAAWSGPGTTLSSVDLLDKHDEELFVSCGNSPVGTHHANELYQRIHF